MLFKRVPSLIILLATHILIPLCIILFLFANEFSSIADWGVKIAAFTLYVSLIAVVGYWGYLSYHLRWLMIFAFMVAIGVSFINLKALPFFSYNNFSNAVLNFIFIIVSLVFVKALIDALRSHFFDEQPVELSFPFRNGTFSIIDGGNGGKSSLMNYHFKALSHKGSGVNHSMKYATDITKLNSFMSSSKGILPQELGKYEIYNENLYSPCIGTVEEVVNQYGNNVPFSGNYPYNVGNCIVIKSGDIFIVMGHLQKDSITVNVGDEVTSGQIVGKIGNCGWTNQPHLHMQAIQAATGSYWQGKGIPILFDGSFPVKNKIYRVS